MICIAHLEERAIQDKRIGLDITIGLANSCLFTMVQKGLGGSSGISSHGALYSSIIFAIATFMTANYLIGITLSAGQIEVIGDNIFISPSNIGTLHQANTNSVAKDRFATVLPANPRIHFIHIGKAGGQTIDDSLGFNGTHEEVHCKVLLEQQDL